MNNGTAGQGRIDHEYLFHKTCTPKAHMAAKHGIISHKCDHSKITALTLYFSAVMGAKLLFHFPIQTDHPKIEDSRIVKS